MKRAPSLRYRASVAGSSPSDWDGVWAKSFLSQYQHGLTWSRVAGSFLSQNNRGLMNSRVERAASSRSQQNLRLESTFPCVTRYRLTEAGRRWEMLQLLQMSPTVQRRLVLLQTATQCVHAARRWCSYTLMEVTDTWTAPTRRIPLMSGKFNVPSVLQQKACTPAARGLLHPNKDPLRRGHIRDWHAFKPIVVAQTFPFVVVLSLLKINVQSQSSVGEQPLNVRTAPRSASRCHVPRACCATTNQRSGIKCSILWAYFTTTPITCARQSRLVSVKEQRNCCCHLKKRYESKKKMLMFALVKFGPGVRGCSVWMHVCAVEAAVFQQAGRGTQPIQ